MSNQQGSGRCPDSPRSLDYLLCELISWKGSHGAPFVRNPCEPIGISFGFMCLEQDHKTSSYTSSCDRHRSRPTRNVGGSNPKKIVIPCFRGHPGILVPGLWGVEDFAPWNSIGLSIPNKYYFIRIEFSTSYIHEMRIYDSIYNI